MSSVGGENWHFYYIYECGCGCGLILVADKLEDPTLAHYEAHHFLQSKQHSTCSSSGALRFGLRGAFLVSFINSWLLVLEELYHCV